MKPFIHLFIGLVLLLQGCDSSIDEEIISQEVLIPIRLAVEENVIPTRTVVSTIDNTNVSNVGIYAVKESKTPGVFPWTASPYYSNIVPSSIAGGGQLSFASKLYYPMGGNRVKFYAYYPRTAATSGSNFITAPGNGTAPIYNFTITGQEDIMYATSSPSGSTNPATVTFTFSHVLTQLKISTGSLLNISTVTLVGIHNQGTLNLETGVVTFNPSTINLSLTAGLIGGAINPFMVQANVPSYTVQVTLSILGIGLVTNNYLIKPVSGNFLPGMTYSITLAKI